MSPRLISFGEILLRVGSEGSLPLGYGGKAALYLGGSECNVAITARALGLASDWVSLLPDSELGRWVAEQLRQTGLPLAHIGYWPHPMAVYFLEQGPRPRVLDRIRGPLAAPDRPALDWEPILAGASHFHTSGISAGLGPTALRDVAQGLRCAREQGLRTSYDFNFRRLLWTLDVARAQQRPLLADIDLLFGGEADLAAMLDLSADEQVADADWPELGRRLFAAYGFDEAVFSQRRDAAKGPHYRVVALRRDERVFSPWFSLAGECIGIGDAMTAGWLSARAAGANLETAAREAAGAGALKAALPGDFYPISRHRLQNWLSQEGHWR